MARLASFDGKEGDLAGYRRSSSPRESSSASSKRARSQRRALRSIFTGPFEYTRQNRYYLSALAELLNIKLREALRENMGGTYGVSVVPGRHPRSGAVLSLFDWLRLGARASRGSHGCRARADRQREAVSDDARVPQQSEGGGVELARDSDQAERVLDGADLDVRPERLAARRDPQRRQAHHVTDGGKSEARRRNSIFAPTTTCACSLYPENFPAAGNK